MKKIHPALAAIRSRQAASSKVDAASIVDAKEDEPLPSSEATPSQMERSSSVPTDGSDDLPTTTPSDDGDSVTTQPLRVIPARTNGEDFTEAVIAAQQKSGDIQFHEFNASNIKSATFDGTQSLLLVSFANGKVFSYENMTLELWNTWLAAKSAGQWFHTQIRQRAKAHPFKEVKSG